MSSLVESRRDNDAASDCSTMSATMSGSRHGRLSQTSRPVTAAVSGPASSAAYRIGASSSTVEMEAYSEAAVRQHGPPSSLFYNDASSLPRLSLKPDIDEHSGIDELSTVHDSDAKLAISATGDERQAGSRDVGSRNTLASGDDAAGEVRSRSADTASNSVEVGCIDDHRRSRDDCYLRTGGAIDIATDEEPPGNCGERKTVVGTERSEQTVRIRCQPRVSDNAQRCNGKQTNSDYSAAGWNLTPKLESTEAGNTDRSSSWSQRGRTDVKLETCVDESERNGSEDDVDSFVSTQLRPSITASSSLSEESQNHLMFTCSGTQSKSCDGAGNSDVISAKSAAGARFD